MIKKIYIKSPFTNQITLISSSKEIKNINYIKKVNRKNYYIYIISNCYEDSEFENDTLIVEINYGPNYTYNYVQELYKDFKIDKDFYCLIFERNKSKCENMNVLKYNIYMDNDYIYYFVLKVYLEHFIYELRSIYCFYAYYIDIDWYTNRFEIIINSSNIYSIEEVSLLLDEHLTNLSIDKNIIDYAFNLLTSYIFDCNYCEIINDIEVSKCKNKN